MEKQEERTPPKHGWHPGFKDPIKLKIWEIRRQLDVNVETIKQNHPDPEPRILPHVIETLTDHVYDRLRELEDLIPDPNKVRQDFINELAECVPAIQTTEHKRELIKAGFRTIIEVWNRKKNAKPVLGNAELDAGAPNHDDPSKRGFDPQ